MGLMSEQESRQTNWEGSFDELAKGLAVGTALVGGALAAIPGVAWGVQVPGGDHADRQHLLPERSGVRHKVRLPSRGALLCDRWYAHVYLHNLRNRSGTELISF
jgi:hypothetical protein